MIATEFEYLAPRDINAALDLLREHADDAKLLAGGMTLMPIMRLGLAHPRYVLSLNHVRDLDNVKESATAVHIGAMTHHVTVSQAPLITQHAPLLCAAARSIGDVQVRNRGTLGGSLAHADPAADYPCAMLALEARFHIRSKDASRCIAATDFFVDVMTTALAPDELLTEIEIPKCSPSSTYAHERLRRVEGAFPIVVASAFIDGSRGRVGLGGIGPHALSLDISEHLGAGASEQAIAAIGTRAYEIAAHALDDLNGSAPYRRAMARVYSQRAVRAALQRED